MSRGGCLRKFMGRGTVKETKRMAHPRPAHLSLRALIITPLFIL